MLQQPAAGRGGHQKGVFQASATGVVQPNYAQLQGMNGGGAYMAGQSPVQGVIFALYFPFVFCFFRVVFTLSLALFSHSSGLPFLR